MTQNELKKMNQIINKVKAGTSMILCTDDDLKVINLKPGKKWSFFDMMKVLMTLGMTYSGEALSYHPVHGTCYRVENGKGEPLAVVHQGIWECEDSLVA